MFLSSAVRNSRIRNKYWNTSLLVITSEIRSRCYFYRFPMDIARSRDLCIPFWYCHGNIPGSCQLLHWCLMGIQEQASDTAESSSWRRINPGCLNFTPAYEHSKYEVELADLITAISISTSISYHDAAEKMFKGTLQWMGIKRGGGSAECATLTFIPLELRKTHGEKWGS